MENGVIAYTGQAWTLVALLDFSPRLNSGGFLVEPKQPSLVFPQAALHEWGVLNTTYHLLGTLVKPCSRLRDSVRHD